MRYRIEVKARAVKALGGIPNPHRRRIAKAIDSLAADPRPPGCRKPKGSGDGYRIRVGDYRIVYRVLDKVLVVYVIRIGRRGDIYRDL